MPALTLESQQRLERVKAALCQPIYSLRAGKHCQNGARFTTAQITAGFYLPPFYINTEQEVLLQASDEGKQIRVRIDVLVFKEQFWVLVIESKRAEFSRSGQDSPGVDLYAGNSYPESTALRHGDKWQ